MNEVIQWIQDKVNIPDKEFEEWRKGLGVHPSPTVQTIHGAMLLVRRDDGFFHKTYYQKFEDGQEFLDRIVETCEFWRAGQESASSIPPGSSGAEQTRIAKAQLSWKGVIWEVNKADEIMER